jgi:formamidopyrimidine-DNA glycosylase
LPELPEVETVARLLRPELVGRRLGASRVRWLRTLGGLGARAFARAVGGTRVTALRRRGKWIVMDLARAGAGAGVLCVHLRMTGRLEVAAAGQGPGPWERLRIALDDGRVLRFVDPRKFGRVRWARAEGEVTGALGPEPLDRGFTAGELARSLRARRRRLKPLLLDQAFLAGLGNIYVDESLHRARLHPLQPAQRLRPAQAEALWRSIRAVLSEAIAREGSSFDAFYRTPEGRPGGFQHEFRVYGRAGEPCRTCGGPIRALVVGQRGTHFCPRCQPRPRRR